MRSPEQYNKFEDHRTRPALDLLEMIPDLEFGSAINLRCGDGYITQMLKKEFNVSKVVGIDSSATMLEVAKQNYTDINWQQNDISTFTDKYELIFSNAALQWLPSHEILFTHLISQTNKVLAVQMPHNFMAPSHVLLRETIDEHPKFSNKLKGKIRINPVLEMDQCYDILSKHTKNINIWETTYLQTLSGEDTVLEWVKGAALVPVADNLNLEEFTEFKDIYNKKLRIAYPKPTDGITLFPFKRIFIVATK